MRNHPSSAATTVWSKKYRGSLSKKDKNLECIFWDERTNQEARGRTQDWHEKETRTEIQDSEANIEFTVKQMFGGLKASCQVKAQNRIRIRLGITWL